MSKKNYSIARVVTHTQNTIGKCERHNERKNESYANMNVDVERSNMNVHFKSCGELTYNEQLNKLIAEKKVCMRGLKANAKVFDEMIFDVNTDYFEKHGGYEYAIEQIVMLELKKMSACIKHNEERFAEILARKTNSDRLSEEKYLKTELERLMSRNAKVERNYEKLYEDNMDGKVTDEWFMHMSRKYEEERIELRTKISKLREQQEQLNNKEKEKELFVSAVRKFMEMETLTAPLLHKLIDHIDIYETEGTGKNKTQRIVIHYRFVGNIEIPSDEENFKLDMRQGMAVEYLTA